VVGVDGRGRQNLTRTAATESELAMSPEGRRIAYLRSERQPFQIWVMNVDGSGQRRLTSGGDWEFGPQWSPDGSRIAFARTSGIRVVPSRGGRPRRIATASLRHAHPSPAWSPTGKQLAYNSGHQLYVARIDGRSTKLVTQGATGTFAGCCQVSPPVWSRNGRRLYYSS
jgi:TolB protein